MFLMFLNRVGSFLAFESFWSSLWKEIEKTQILVVHQSAVETVDDVTLNQDYISQNLLECFPSDVAISIFRYLYLQAINKANAEEIPLFQGKAWRWMKAKRKSRKTNR